MSSVTCATCSHCSWLFFCFSSARTHALIYSLQMFMNSFIKNCILHKYYTQLPISITFNLDIFVWMRRRRKNWATTLQRCTAMEGKSTNNCNMCLTIAMKRIKTNVAWRKGTNETNNFYHALALSLLSWQFFAHRERIRNESEMVCPVGTIRLKLKWRVREKWWTKHQPIKIHLTV